MQVAFKASGQDFATNTKNTATLLFVTASNPTFHPLCIELYYTHPSQIPIKSPTSNCKNIDIISKKQETLGRSETNIDM